MQRLVILSLFVLSASCWGQSLGEVARQLREKEKPHARKTITNDDLADSHASIEAANPERDLEAARKVLKDMCETPQADKERALSESEKQTVAAAVRTVRQRRDLSEQKLKEYGRRIGDFAAERKASLDSQFSNEHPPTADENQHLKAINNDYKERFEAFIGNAKAEGKFHEELSDELGLAAKHCSSAF